MSARTIPSGVWRVVACCAQRAVVPVPVSDQVWMLLLVFHCEVCEFNVKVLVDAVQRAFELEVVLELHDHLLADQTLEELKEMLKQHTHTKRDTDSRSERAEATNTTTQRKRRREEGRER